MWSLWNGGDGLSSNWEVGGGGGGGSDKRRILLNSLCRLGKRLGLSSPRKSEEWQRALSSVSDLEGNS